MKYRKMMRGRMRGKAYRGAEVHFGDYGLQAVEPGWLTARQLEAARRAIVRGMKRRGKIWIRVFPDKPVTHQPAETRMGGGKGNVEYYVAVIRPGRVLFELGGGLPDDIAREALRLAQYKLAIKTKIITRHEYVGGEE
jgi:large subunit ribosomal protein L16